MSSEATKAALKRHMKNIHRPWDFHCPLCEYRGTSQALLNAHFKRNHGVQEPLQCTLCPMMVSTKAKMRTHMKKEHQWAHPGLQF